MTQLSPIKWLESLINFSTSKRAETVWHLIA